MTGETQLTSYNKHNHYLNYDAFFIKIFSKWHLKVCLSMSHPCDMLVSGDLIHPITTGMHKGAGEKEHEAGLSLVIPRRMPHHSSSSS
jgi:ribosomal protein L16 Arg81 hydroxylase